MAAFMLASRNAFAAPPASPATLPDDPFASYREQFKLGMERYRAGALAEAIGFWEPIYRELGDSKGYRLAFDLGVAYQQLGDATHAAERLQAFLTEVEARRSRGNTLESIVEREEVDARARVETLIATKGRIHVEAVSTPRSARLDASEPRLAGFVAWVTPGEHHVTFAVGTPEQETKTVVVRAGELIEVAPTPPASPLPSPGPVGVYPPPATRTPVLIRREIRHPFVWPLMAVTGGVAAAMAIVAAPLEDHAWQLYDRYRVQPPDPVHQDDFRNARTSAYAAVAGAIGFAAVTAGLVTWYFLGTAERDVIITPAAAPEHGGASLAVTGRF
jgi:hypothetical protein